MTKNAQAADHQSAQRCKAMAALAEVAEWFAQMWLFGWARADWRAAVDGIVCRDRVPQGNRERWFLPCTLAVSKLDPRKRPSRMARAASLVPPKRRSRRVTRPIMLAPCL